MFSSFYNRIPPTTFFEKTVLASGVLSAVWFVSSGLAFEKEALLPCIHSAAMTIFAYACYQGMIPERYFSA